MAHFEITNHHISEISFIHKSDSFDCGIGFAYIWTIKQPAVYCTKKALIGDTTSSKRSIDWW